MKTKLVVFFVLLLCLGGLALSLGHNMRDAAENPKFEFDTIYGNQSEADGANISLQMKALNNNGYCWSSNFSFGNKAVSYNTTHSIDYFGENQSFEIVHIPVSAYINYFGGSEGLVFHDRIEQELSNMKADAEGYVRKNVRVADYFDYYPLCFSFCKPDSGLVVWSSDFNSDQDDPLKEEFEQFFRIPVLEDEMLEVSYNKNRPGSLNISSGVYYDEEYEIRMTNYDPFTTACQFGGSVYFSISPYGNGGNLMDFSLIPEGYGIYTLRFSEDGNPIPGSLSTLCSLDKSYFVEEIRSSGDEKYIYFFAVDGDQKLHIMSVSVSTGEIICDLFAGEYGSYVIKEKDDYMILTMNRPDEMASFVIGQSENGILNILLESVLSHDTLWLESNNENASVDFLDHSYYWYPSKPFDAAYDGEKLYLLVCENKSSYGDRGICFRLLVFDCDKLLYIGRCSAGADFRVYQDKYELDIQK